MDGKNWFGWVQKEIETGRRELVEEAEDAGDWDSFKVLESLWTLIILRDSPRGNLNVCLSNRYEYFQQLRERTVQREMNFHASNSHLRETTPANPSRVSNC